MLFNSLLTFVHFAWVLVEDCLDDLTVARSLCIPDRTVLTFHNRFCNFGLEDSEAPLVPLAGWRLSALVSWLAAVAAAAAYAAAVAAACGSLLDPCLRPHRQ